jgi:hypothetical protein
LYKIHTILDVVVNNFRTNYIPDREISLNPLNTELNPICHLLALLGGATIVVVSRIRVDEGMLGWRGHLRFCVYNPGKITKYGILVQMVCESSTGYVCNLQIYDGKCGPLTEMLGFLFEPYQGIPTQLLQ